MNTKERIASIEKYLNQALQPTTLEIIDDSEEHIGHAGAQSGAGHFTVKIAASSFTGKTPVQCHRMIYQALDDLMKTEIHALRIEILTS